MAGRMRKTILGRKLGSSQAFDGEGNRVQVTLIEAGPCTVLQVKTDEKEGYQALQVGFIDSPKEPNKPRGGIFEKVGCPPKRFVREIPSVDGVPQEAGESFDLTFFEGVESVDVSGVSKGKGFQGNVKRWNHAIGPKSHGSKSKRNVGSTGMHQDPGRVIKGKKMPGQMGNENVKVRNLQVISADAEKNLLVVQGSVPGPTGGYLTIEESI